MNKVYSKYLDGAITALADLPGIGRKSAMRIALYLLKQPVEKVEVFSHAIEQMRKDITECEKCFNLAEGPYCNLCLDPSRMKTTICVVEDIRDVMAIEETGQYNGRYHVLGGVISPIEGIGPEILHIDMLIRRIKDDNIKE
ncbi:MAG: recombination protein RecR, partial [Saprospiraceae bacterium]|nr:recombination protein RecR [Saprospiraceae bacterium]